MKKIIAVLTAVFIAVGGFLILNQNSKYDFKGKDVNGPVSLKTFDGKYKIVYFGYPSCPDVGPAILVIFAGVFG